VKKINLIIDFLLLAAVVWMIIKLATT